MKTRWITYQDRFSLCVLTYQDGMPCPIFCGYLGSQIESKGFDLSSTQFSISEKTANGVVPLYLACKILGRTLVDLIKHYDRKDQFGLFVAYSCCFDRRFLSNQANLYAGAPSACTQQFSKFFNPESNILVERNTYEIRIKSILNLIGYLGTCDLFDPTTVAKFLIEFKEASMRFQELLRKPTKTLIDLDEVPEKIEIKMDYQERNGSRNYLIRLIADELDWGKIRISNLDLTHITLSDSSSSIAGHLEPLSKELSQCLAQYIENEMPIVAQDQPGSPLFMTGKGHRLTPVAISKILEVKQQ